jgi:hypothetical protein
LRRRPRAANRIDGGASPAVVHPCRPAGGKSAAYMIGAGGRRQRRPRRWQPTRPRRGAPDGRDATKPARHATPKTRCGEPARGDRPIATARPVRTDDRDGEGEGGGASSSRSPAPKCMAASSQASPGSADACRSVCLKERYFVLVPPCVWFAGARHAVDPFSTRDALTVPDRSMNCGRTHVHIYRSNFSSSR